jgi:hypothetical protein
LTLTSAVGINDNGWIIAYGTDTALPAGTGYAYLLVPQ